VAPVTYREEDQELDVAAGGTVDVGVGVPTADGGGTGVLWSSRPPPDDATRTTTAARPPPVAATRTDAARPPHDADYMTAAARPTSTQGKPTFDEDAVGIPDAEHASIGGVALYAAAVAIKYQSEIYGATPPSCCRHRQSHSCLLSPQQRI
jgi:hypothetical protein